MKMSPEFQRAAAAMGPGQISKEGFLGNDTRSLVDIIQADEEEMGRLGLSFETVTERLTRIFEEGKKAYGTPVVFESWRITLIEARGSIPCPFKDMRFAKQAATITHRVTGQALAVSNLSLHLFS